MGDNSKFLGIIDTRSWDFFKWFAIAH